MLSRRIAGRYAEALFGLAQQQQKITEWEQELDALARVMQATPELHDVLTHPEIPLQQKERVVTQAFQGKVSREVLALLFMLLRRGHDPDMQVVHDIYVTLWNAARQLLPVTITSAVPLTDTQVGALSQAISRRTGSKLKLSVEVDNELIAGLVVRMGDRVIDASVRTTLEELRATLVSA